MHMPDWILLVLLKFILCDKLYGNKLRNNNSLRIQPSLQLPKQVSMEFSPIKVHNKL